ncbi:MAG: helix-turn-helix domain-containing protein [Giesbergeria sp.]|uniref:helix-turn-helix domain-containing protein n=1 Tax=Giesbergeria sp. TaxID=2818473 RepID=UPI002617E199|nr:helix-turn-helix domain-containing protein [Giesbergeria sp.]MDD2611099.1 helix-turn-helix domain-containing protein [Giesbergeria sp.]
MANTATATATPPIFGNIRADNLRIGQITMFAKMSSSLKLLVRAICDHHNEQAGFAWPSVERLALICSTTTRTIRRQLNQLKNMGLLVILNNIPGIKTQGYVVREEHLATLMIDKLKPTAKSTLSDAAAFVQQALSSLDNTSPPIAPAVPEPPVASIVEHPVIIDQPPVAPIEPEAALIVPIVEPAVQAPIVEQPPTAPTVLHIEPEAAPVVVPPAAPPVAIVIDAEKLQAVNAQRVANGKSAMLPSDISRMAQEATAAKITLMQAVDWVLERPTRNFFRASFYTSASAPQPIEIVAAVPVEPPTPEQIAERQAARKAQEEERAIQEANDRAKVKAFMEEYKSKQAAEPCPTGMEKIEVAGMVLSGPDWAMSAIRDFNAGKKTNLFRMEAACSVLGISYQTLRKARNATPHPAAKIAPAVPAAPASIEPAIADTKATKPVYLMTEAEFEAAREAALSDEEVPF